MATNKQLPKSPTQMVTDVKVKRSRESVMTDVCEHLTEGKSLQEACRIVTDVKSHTILTWVEKYPELRDQYMQARARGYQLLADEIIAISDEADVEARYQNEDVKLVLDATAVARNRLRIDTRKWMLAKMLPKVYGDKVTSEITGANGGPVQIAALSLNSLSDAELSQMQVMLSKASAGGG